MILASIINIWDGCEILPFAIRSTVSRVNLYIFVWQDVSNFGEKYDPLPELMAIEEMFPEKKFVFVRYEPLFHASGTANETNKRNLGIQKAREYKATHFLFQDADELYEDFPARVDTYTASGCDGSVCKIYTYFKLPTLRFANPDNYFVPFIHKLHAGTRAGTSDYPFYVDPTRSWGAETVAEMPFFMHHFSYIRRDIGRKLRNSSAKENIARSTIARDWELAVPGYHVKPFFDQVLIEVDNKFGIEI